MSVAAGPGILDELRAALADPATRHAMLVHLPVAMSSLGVVVALGAAFWRRSRTPRVVALAWYAVMAIAAFVAMQSGQDAEATLPPHLSAAAFERVDVHEQMGDWLYLIAAATAGLFVVALVRDRIVRFLATTLAVAMAVFCAGWTAVLAHHGGTLVYEFGVGTRLVDRPPVPDNRDDDTLSAGAAMDVAVDAHGQAVLLDPETAARVAFFEQTIEPILVARCQSCHNASRPKSRLNLTTREGALTGGALGEPAIVAGDPLRSVLLQVVRGEHPEIELMPPDEPLPMEEVAALEQWIRDGAAWGTTGATP